MGASLFPLMMFTLLWGGVGIVLPFLVPKGATQGLPDSLNDQESQPASDSSMLSFHPKYFDFEESPVGVPRLGVIRVDNRLKNENLKLISISGNTVHFHSSFFADKVIGPESNTTFEVVFLSRVEGLVESNLYIHTSKGLFKYFVKGYGLPNPYRLKPLVGARIPVNGTYEPLITMHNTHDTRIQVVEMHSSGADFHLQLPDNVEQDAGSAWAIEPFETKHVMKGSFQGKADGNHTGFIKIRVNSTNAASSEYLLLPVEVQVSSEPGMYSPQDALDFGLLVQTDKPRTLSLFIINAERKPVNIMSVTVKGVPNPAVKIEFRPLVIEPDNSVSTVVALVTFDPSLAQDPKYTHGNIQILSECGKSVTVPFRANVMHGALEYNASSLGFFVKADNIPQRNFSVRNNFSATVAIYHVAVSHPDLVRVNSFNQTHIIPPGEQKAIFSMRIQRKSEICDTRNKIEVTVKSNITNMKLPLMCYDGKLQLHTFENGEIDCGRIEMYSSHTEYFSLENKNPVEIRLKSWGSNSSWGHVELVGMQKGVKEDLEKIRDFDSLKKSLFLQPGHMAVFSIDVRRPTAEGTFFGEAYVTTDHNQTLRVPFRFAVSKGSVYADTFVFDKVFPGKISCEKLYLGSSYNRTLLLSSIRSRPPKLVWFSASNSESQPEIPPMRRSYIGKVHFDPRKFCEVDCYAGFPMDSTIGKLWTRALSLGWDGGEIDWQIFSTLQTRFESVSDTSVSNISVWIDTNEAGGYKVPTQLNYIWPRISTLRPIVFPLTALGNESVVEIPVSNPSSFPLLVQASLAKEYGPQWSKFAPGLQSSLNLNNFTAGDTAFQLSGVLSSSSQQNGSSEISDVQMRLFRDILGLKEHHQDSPSSTSSFPPGISFVLPPGAKYFLRTSFRPLSKDIASTVILLRNNLTGIEIISTKGRAGTGQLTVGSGTPGSSLLFQLTEKLLQACQADSTSKYVPPQLTVRRSFIARNIGEIPLDIRRLEIYPPQNSFLGFNWHIPFGLGGSIPGVGGGVPVGGVGEPVGGLGGGVSSGVGSGGGPGGTGGVAPNPSPPGEYCEGYGFRILNCHPFTLQPNHTHSIDIAFSPDFTMSKVIRTLRLVDSTGGEFNYTLVAMIPSKMLSICSSVISRPSWEYLLKIFLVIGVTVAIIASALMAYVEAGSVVSSTVVATVRVLPPNETPSRDGREQTSKLDLKAVYDRVENRFKRSKESSGAAGKSSVTVTTSGGTALASGTNNAIGNGVGAKGSQIVANGSASVLSSNNNAALRNRKTKKGAIEQFAGSATASLVSGVAAATGKLLDRSNQNQKSSSPPVEDTSGCFSKKNKENSPTSGVDSTNSSVAGAGSGKKKKGQSQNSSQNAQPGNSSALSNSNTNSKKKRRGSGGGSGSLPSVCLVPSSGSKGQSKAEQEETSSTTTESSNSDDFYMPPASEKKCSSQQQQQQGKGSRTSSPQENVGGTSQISKSGKKDGNNGGGSSSNKKKQDSGNKQDSDFLTTLMDGDTSSSIGGHQKSSSPADEISSSMSGSSGKKKNMKKKDQPGQNHLNPSGNLYSMETSTGNGKLGDGKTSPSVAGRYSLHQQHHHDNMQAMWDSPQCPMGDGLSELAAQTEAFVMHRPNTTSNKNTSKSNSAEHLGGSASGGDSSGPTSTLRHRNSHSPQFSQVLQMTQHANYQSQQQQQNMMHMGGMGGNVGNMARQRRPPAGIIGQSRYGGGIISPTAAYFQTPNGHIRQHTPPTRTMSNPSSANSAMGMGGGGGGGWGQDILPDNGCDIWSRKNSLEAGNGPNMPPTFSSVAGSSSAAGSHANENMPMYSMPPPSYASIFDGFPNTSSPGMSHRNADDGGYFSLSGGGNPGSGGSAGGNVPVSSYGGNRTNVRGAAADSSQMFNYGIDIFNTLNLPYDMAHPHRSAGVGVNTSTAAGGRPVQIATNSNSVVTHNYLHRIRSEPGDRDDAARAFGNAGSKNWNELATGYYDVENMGLASSRLMNRSSNSPAVLESKNDNSGDTMAWPASPSPVGGSNDSLPRGDRGLFSDWSTLSTTAAQAGRRSVGNVSEIWEPATSGTGQEAGLKWPPAFETANPAEAVSRGNALGELGGFRNAPARNSDVPQSHHREVEAGLGFNPFTSNIWNQNHPADTTWSSSSSTGNYRYNNRD